MPKELWTDREIALVNKYPRQYDLLEKLLPNRSRRHICDMTEKLGLCNKRRGRTTDQEIEIIKKLWPDKNAITEAIPGMSKFLIWSVACRRLGLPNPRSRSNFTDEEVAAIKSGVKHLPNRSWKAVCTKRSKLGFPILLQWTTAEDAALKLDPRAKIAGRSKFAIKHHRVKPGIKIRSTPQVLIGSVSVGANILDAIQRAIPRTLPRQIQQEVLSDLTLAVLEGEIELAGVAGAVSKAIKGVYKRYPVLGAPVSLDMPLFDDGGATLGDRITSDTFHF